MYERFDLTLPKETTIRRPSAGTIVLENNRFKLSIIVKYAGFSAVVPFDFIQYYIGENPFEVHAQHVDIELKYEVRPLSLLREAGWEYYQWVDSFVSRVQAEMSGGQFLRRIGWDTVATLIHIIEGGRLTSFGSGNPPPTNQSNGEP